MGNLSSPTQQLNASQTVGAETIQRLQTRPEVLVTISQRSQSITAALDVRIRISNLTESDIHINDVRLVMPGDFLAARGDSTRIVRNIGQLMNSGQQRNVSFYLPAYKPSLRSLPNFQLLTFNSGIHEGNIVVSYRVPPDQNTDLSETFNLELEASLLSLMVGGALGALLMSIFRVIGRGRKDADLGMRRLLRDSLFLWTSGGVTAIIIIFLVQRIEDLPLPVNVAINDIFGGIIVGLLSYRLSLWLYPWLFGDEEVLRQYRNVDR